MKIKKETRKVCDVCRVTVAVKDKLSYKTMVPYTTLRHDTFSFDNNPSKRDDKHICTDCWSDIVDALRSNLHGD